MSDQSEVIGRICDRLDSLSEGLSMKLPENMHLEQLKRIIPEIAKELKLAFIAQYDDNPWEDSPFDPNNQ